MGLCPSVVTPIEADNVLARTVRMTDTTKKPGSTDLESDNISRRNHIIMSSSSEASFPRLKGF
jgi:hypothetical protein